MKRCRIQSDVFPAVYVYPIALLLNFVGLCPLKTKQLLSL